MKKSIVYLALALVTLTTNAAMASTVATASKSETVMTFKASNTPLANAISRGDVETVKKFIEYGVDVNEKSNGVTPLMLAARYNNVEIINMLVAKGANLKAKDEKGNTALKYAEMSKCNEAIAAIKALLA